MKKWTVDELDDNQRHHIQNIQLAYYNDISKIVKFDYQSNTRYDPTFSNNQYDHQFVFSNDIGDFQIVLFLHHESNEEMVIINILSY